MEELLRDALPSNALPLARLRMSKVRQLR
jgi:hypothetical protein